MDSLSHPWFATTKLSYRFPIFETSAIALRGITRNLFMFSFLFLLKFSILRIWSQLNSSHLFSILHCSSHVAFFYLYHILLFIFFYFFSDFLTSFLSNSHVFSSLLFSHLLSSSQLFSDLFSWSQLTFSTCAKTGSQRQPVLDTRNYLAPAARQTFPISSEKIFYATKYK